MTTLYDFFVVFTPCFAGVVFATGILDCMLLSNWQVLFSLPVFWIVCYSPTNWQIINDSNPIVKHFKFLKKIFYFAARYLTTSFIFPNIKIFELELQLYMY